MKLWLDDIRDPEKHNHSGWFWAKTAEEAIILLRDVGTVTEASLDHDLTDEQMNKGGIYGKIYEDGHKSGMDVVDWLEQHIECYPVDGIVVHSANPAGRARMEVGIKGIEKRLRQRSGYVV